MIVTLRFRGLGVPRRLMMVVPSHLRCHDCDLCCVRGVTQDLRHLIPPTSQRVPPRDVRSSLDHIFKYFDKGHCPPDPITQERGWLVVVPPGKVRV